MRDAAAEDWIRPYLNPGETLVWSGRPAQGIRFGSKDILLVPFSLLWGGFAIFWEALALFASSKAHQPVALFFPLWGIPFVLVGLYLIAGRFWADAWIRARTVYGLSDRRAFLVRRTWKEEVLTAGLGQNVTLRRGRDGRGDIEFGAQSAWPFRSGALWMPAMANAVSFLGVADVAAVYRLTAPPA